MERHTPDSTILFQRSCSCNGTNSSELPLVYTSTGKEIEVHFISTNMTTDDDPDSMNFEATYEFIKGPYMCKEPRKMSGPSGTTSLSHEDVKHSNSN